jgi:putative membrane protein
MGYCYGLSGYGSTLGGFWWIMPLLFWGLIITGVVLLVRSNRKKGSYQALDTLKHEYALGRISREEFISRKKDLQ